MKKNLIKALVEAGFIIFLFYSNLLMGQFTNSGSGGELGVLWAIGNIFTLDNFAIALITAVVGYVIFGFLRKQF